MKSTINLGERFTFDNSGNNYSLPKGNLKVFLNHFPGRSEAEFVQERFHRLRTDPRNRNLPPEILDPDICSHLQQLPGKQ